MDSDPTVRVTHQKIIDPKCIALLRLFGGGAFYFCVDRDFGIILMVINK